MSHSTFLYAADTRRTKAVTWSLSGRFNHTLNSHCPLTASQNLQGSSSFASTGKIEFRSCSGVAFYTAATSFSCRSWPRERDHHDDHRCRCYRALGARETGWRAGRDTNHTVGTASIAYRNSRETTTSSVAGQASGPPKPENSPASAQRDTSALQSGMAPRIPTTGLGLMPNPSSSASMGLSPGPCILWPGRRGLGCHELVEGIERGREATTTRRKSSRRLGD